MTQDTTSPMREKRLRLGLTLRDLAAKCKQAGSPISAGQLSRIERRQMTPNPRLRRTLVRILRVRFEDLEAQR